MASGNGTKSQEPELIDILISRGCVITMDRQRRVIDDGSVAISGGKIVAVGPADEVERQYRGKKTLNARRKTVMPGLHDLHSHAGVELVKGTAERYPGPAWRNIMDFVSYHTSAEWWYLESLLSALQRLKCGTTQALYMLGNAPRGDTADIPVANAKAVEQVGLRSISAFGPSRPPWPREYTYWKDGRRIERLVTLEETFEVTDDTIGRWNDAHPDGRVQMWVAVSRILNANYADVVYDPQNEHLIRPQAEGIRRIMEKRNVGFHCHGMGTTAEFCYDADLGLLGPKTVFGHGWPFRPRSVEILAETGTRVVHCPRARRVYFFAGRLPIPELIDAGVLVGIGSDSCGMDRPYDSIWDDMYIAPRWQRLELREPNVLPPGKLLEMATIDGAEVVGLGQRTGSLEIGKDADIILVNMWQPHLAPVAMEPTRVAQLARGSDVETVMVEGQILMEDRKVLTVNEDDILEWAQAEAEHTYELFGLGPLLQPSANHWGHSQE
jgi:cytosine/adenosine deaminase-related metal-dependent hydrolase